MTLTAKMLVPNYNRVTDSRKVYRGAYGACRVPVVKVRAAIKRARAIIEETGLQSPDHIFDAYRSAAKFFGLDFKYLDDGRRYWAYTEDWPRLKDEA